MYEYNSTSTITKQIAKLVFHELNRATWKRLTQDVMWFHKPRVGEVRMESRSAELPYTEYSTLQVPGGYRLEGVVPWLCNSGLTMYLRYVEGIYRDI